MSTSRKSVLETIIARISHGSVPFDGVYWLDPDGDGQVSAQDSGDVDDDDTSLLPHHLAPWQCTSCD